jgi:antirestriction protein ArdC
MRKMPEKGMKSYAFEELVAEMAAAFVCAHLGLPYNNQHATYIESWLQSFKDNPKVLCRATTARTGCG